MTTKKKKRHSCETISDRTFWWKTFQNQYERIVNRIKLHRKRRSYRQLLIEHLDENILKSIRKYWKSNKVIRRETSLIQTISDWILWWKASQNICWLNKTNKRDVSSNIEYKKQHANKNQKLQTSISFKSIIKK